ncbi:MAG: hypothetical protein FD156_1990 [Nitrospirae bacterium]|nr:MAG: hypothetical protein FD156_1990 [Nitrospirota bacterium]
MIDKELIANLRLVHGSYNAMMMFLFIYQGWLGLKIRRGRTSGNPQFATMKRHRKSGPVFAIMGVTGFLAGATLIYLDYGRLLKYPPHFITGLAVVFSITTAFLISRKIKGTDSAWRTPHFRRGLLVLCLYLIQVFLGIGILF